MLPNFLIVGAEKAGTTTLATMLSAHPDVFMCNPKEPRFFTHNWEKGVKWYECLFRGGVGYNAIGEASPAYTWAPASSKAPKRIFECLGNIKYIYMVRHPIERMISHYRHAIFHRWIPDDISFEAALELSPGLKNCSRYFYQVEQYLPFSRREQWHVIALEELITGREDTVKDVCRFLDICDARAPQLKIRNVTDEKIRAPKMFNHLDSMMPYFPRSGVRLIRKIGRRFGKAIDKPELSSPLRATLIAEFKPDIQRLSSFYGRDFSAIWRMH